VRAKIAADFNAVEKHQVSRHSSKWMACQQPEVVRPGTPAQFARCVKRRRPTRWSSQCRLRAERQLTRTS
jgi:hypothetical protein